MRAADLPYQPRPSPAGLGSITITPSDSTTYSRPVIRSLYCTGAGNVTFTAVDGTIDSWTVAAFSIIPVAMTAVAATGTTATGLRGIL